MIARCAATAFTVMLALSASGCQSLGEALVALDEGLYEAVPLHPVTGRPTANLISEDREIQIAEQAWTQIAASASKNGAQIDPPGDRLNQVRAVFENLVAVAHRQHLPWTLHFLRHPLPNAMTPGGGMVIWFEGIFTDYPGGKGFLQPRDDEVAAVMAHEIAHVTLLHMAERQTSRIFTDRHKKDPFYSASYTTTDEAEADKLSVLYMALAGYDPRAAPQMWARIHSRSGSDPGLYLYSHPLNDDRMQQTSEAAAQVLSYYSPRQRNGDWQSLLLDNPLFPRAVSSAPTRGGGFLRAGEATLEAIGRHRAAKEEAEAREDAARLTPQVQATLVRLLETKLDNQGRQLIWMHFKNGARYDVARIGVKVTYIGQQKELAEDPECGGPASIRAGQTVWLACDYHRVRGADAYSVEITGVEFR